MTVIDFYNKPSPFTCLSLAHHGILGQKWGKRNGPPYPLDAEDHSASERKAGWRKSLDKGDISSYNKKRRQEQKPEEKRKGLTSGQKKAIAIGATAAAVALASYGAYRLGYLDRFKNRGSLLTGDIFDKIGDQPISQVGEAAQKPKNDFKRIKEPLKDSIQKANPLLGSEEGTNNCTYCAVAGAMRMMGFDVVAKGTGGTGRNLGVVADDCFRGARILEGNAKTFGKSPKDAAELLKKKFGDNAYGMVGAPLTENRGGHAFSWRIQDGVVEFFDFQQKRTNDTIVQKYWNHIDPNGYLTLVRLDNAEINMDTIHKYVNPRK